MGEPHDPKKGSGSPFFHTQLRLYRLVGGGEGESAENDGKGFCQRGGGLLHEKEETERVGVGGGVEGVSALYDHPPLPPHGRKHLGKEAVSFH